ncbi:MAG: BTAD domain-containing putative transcriptional regulator [Chloroflexota bacterium]
MLQLSLLGSLTVQWAQRPLSKLTAQKVQALLIYLAVESNRVHQRDSLMALFWPDYPQKSAQQSLRQTLYLIKQALPSSEIDAPFILTERITVAWNPDAPLSLDVLRFEQLFANDRFPNEWQQAVDLYSGHFLADFYLPDSEPFEEWVGNKRAFYQRHMHELLERITHHYLTIGQLNLAETAVRRQLELDNLQEGAHRQLIDILARNGRRQEALTHFQKLEQLLEAELGIDPEPDTVTLIEKIREGQLIEKPTADVLSLHHQQALGPQHNLPHLLTEFIGRGNELTEITELLRTSRLVSLIGVGGIGKTTLSVQAGHALVGDFAHGVWMIEFAPMTDQTFLVPAILRSLGIQESTSQSPIEQLKVLLGPKEQLLIFDNCEHLIQPIAEIAQLLLQACPKLKILATSRELLDITGERPFYVPSLSLPNADELIDPEQWQMFEAMQLFVTRAQDIVPHFRVTEDNLASVVYICQQLDGIPLALELAVARVKTLSISQIGKHLDQRFRLLTSGNRAALARHQTLRGMVDWSWDLLSEDEQKLLRRLTVFSGGMNLAAITAVCTNSKLDEFATLDLLSKLVNKSLLNVTQQEAEPRYHLLETIKQYGFEKLAQAGEVDPFAQRHFDYFLQFGEQAERELIGSNQVEWLNQLSAELENIRIALVFAQKNYPDNGLRLSNYIWRFWEVKGMIREGEAWIASFLEQTDETASSYKAKALGVQSHFNFLQFLENEAREQAEACLAIYLELGDREGVAFANHKLSWWDIDPDLELLKERLEESLTIYTEFGNELGVAETYELLGNTERNEILALEYTQKALEIFERLGHLAGMGSCYHRFGFIAFRNGQLEEALHWFENDFAIREQLNKQGVDWTTGLIGEINGRLGNYDLAIEQLASSVEIGKQFGVKGMELWGIVGLGYVFLWKGETDQAWFHFKQGVESFKNTPVSIGTIYAIQGIILIAVQRERVKEAIQLIAWTDNQRIRIHDPRPPIEQADIDQAIAIIQDMVDEDEYDAIYESGETFSWDDGVALALTMGPE